ncbi:MAG: LPS-assembly protein LptD, partial [Vicinamibacterales bacterium]
PGVPPPSGQTPAAQPPVSTPAPQGYTSSQWRLERVSSTHIRMTGQVEIEHQSGVKLFADELDLHTDTDTLTASGNVVFTNLEGRISAERVEFNTRTQTGTFHQASGIMSLGPKAERVQFGNQDPDVYFYGDTVSKIGEKKYRITRGGFTTCVQPTPRWELTSGSVTLNLQDYALLTNTVLRVKGVPVFYLPLAYYPMQEDQRSTGFLLPTYGTSTIRGQGISNAFFWAINRSHDATFFHDWFTRTGQGYGSEYRYVTNAESAGTVLIYRFNQKAAEFRDGNVTGTLPESRSFKVRASATQTLARGLRARARVDYFSDVVSQQLYQQNVYDASQRSRVIQGAVTGAWGPYNASVAYDQNEVFNDERRSFLYGSTPRVSGGVAPTALFRTPVYASVNGEVANLPYRSELDGVPVPSDDRGLLRMDVAPLVRMPFSRWTFLTLNTSAAYRFTRYSESLDAQGIQVPEPFMRSYFDIRADAVGPVFTKIWDAAPDSRAERYKHVIEPTFAYQHTTPIEDHQRTPLLSQNADFVIGGVGRLTYGLTNRLLRRDRPREGVAAGAREFLSVSVQQTYYSDSQTSRFDPNYASSVSSRAPVALSPVALTVRYSPTQATTASTRIEHDVNGGGMQSLSASGSVYAGSQSVNASLSRRRYDKTRDAETHLSAGGTAGFLEGRLAGTYALSWDITRRYIVSQTMSATYFAQCCGFSVEFQNFNYPQISSSFPLPADRRINFSFTLAGLGTFSNFFGAFGGNRGR